MNFESLLFTELRTIAINISENTLTDETLILAMTVNEELKALGYTLSPSGIVSLAKCNELDTILTRIVSYIPDVKAKPMYPNFPTQVMEMSEAVFRFHQMLHYLSTYGVELFTGALVSKGWLPDVEDTEKIEEDTTLLNAKVIQVFEITRKYNAFDYAYTTILSKRERMTDKERMIIQECVLHINENSFNTAVKFKQNLLDIFYTVFTSNTLDNYKKKCILHAICQHTGDVWKCIDYTLTKCKFHFKTSQKRLLVKLLESYDITDFSDNLLISNKKGLRVNLMIQYLDFNVYARNFDFKCVVADFRDGKLRSWESLAKEHLNNKDGMALPFICSRPGTAIRMLTSLLRADYNSKDIYTNLKSKSVKLSTQTLVSLCNQFSSDLTESLRDKYNARLTEKQKANNPEKYKYGINFYELEKERQEVYSICYALLKEKMLSIVTPLQNKKVFIDMSEYNLDKSILLTNDKSDEGGYVRSGIAYSIPENTNIIRFFVYWNHKYRTDIDLHAFANCDSEIREIGWNGGYNQDGIVFSGDITHSDAAEYIDVDLNKCSANTVTFNINVFNGPTFKDFDDCYVGVMAVDKLNTKIKLYNPKNCFFTHRLTSDATFMHYGYLDVVDKCIIFDGDTAHRTFSYYTEKDRLENKFNLSMYIKDLLDMQCSQIVGNTDDADVILVMGKPTNDKEISLIDNNFFMDI